MPRTPKTAAAKPAAKRTRKAPAKAPVICRVCETNAAELGLTCNECNEKLNAHEALYVAGITGNAEARAALKKLTVAERTQIAPVFLSEDDLDAFIKKGVITGRHQAATRTARLAGKTEEITVSRTATQKLAAHTPVEQPAVRVRTRRPAGKKAAPAKATPAAPVATVKPKATVEGTPASQVAAAAGIDARAFRKFLRAQSIDRTFATPAAAKKAVAAFKKASK